MGRPKSQVDVCNLALDHLNQAPISNIETPTTRVEQLCARWCDHVRLNVLRKHSWNFATKRGLLPALAEVPTFEYTSAYQLPNDFVRLASVGETGEIRNYQLEDSKILTFETTNPLAFKYIYDFKDVSKMDSLFVTLWVLELAIALGYPITGSRDAERILETKIDKEAPQAYAIDGQERPPTRRENSKFKDRRFSGARSGTKYL